MDFESKESKEMKNLSTSEKKVPCPYDFSSDEIHRTKNLFGVVLTINLVSPKSEAYRQWLTGRQFSLQTIVASHSGFLNCPYWSPHVGCHELGGTRCFPCRLIRRAAFCCKIPCRAPVFPPQFTAHAHLLHQYIDIEPAVTRWREVLVCRELFHFSQNWKHRSLDFGNNSLWSVVVFCSW